MKVSSERVKRMPKRHACPACGSANLLTEGPDQFCCSCDWDTCAEYVERGLMNNIEMAFREHFPMKRESVTKLNPRREVFADAEHQEERRPVEVGA